MSILHPATYLNKVLVASSQGSMQLWNIRTQFVLPHISQFPGSDIPLRACIHKYSASNLLSGSATSDSNSAITCLVQSPAIDVVGIGFASGEISVYDIRADERLMRVFMREGSVRSLAFRSGTSQFGALVAVLESSDMASFRSHEPRWYADPFRRRLDRAHRFLGPQLRRETPARNPRSP